MNKHKKKRRLLYIALLIGIMIAIILSSTRITDVTVSAELTVPQKGTELIALYWTIGVIGGFIAITLSYVSWRKYLGQRKRDKKKTNG